MVSIVEDEPIVSRDAYSVSYKPALPAYGPFVKDDLEATPDDGHRYEIIEGMLLVSAAPGRLHQRAVLELGGRSVRAARGVPPHRLAAERREAVRADSRG